MIGDAISTNDVHSRGKSTKRSVSKSEKRSLLTLVGRTLDRHDYPPRHPLVLNFRQLRRPRAASHHHVIDRADTAENCRRIVCPEPGVLIKARISIETVQAGTIKAGHAQLRARKIDRCVVQVRRSNLRGEQTTVLKVDHAQDRIAELCAHQVGILPVDGCEGATFDCCTSERCSGEVDADERYAFQSSKIKRVVRKRAFREIPLLFSGIELYSIKIWARQAFTRIVDQTDRATTSIKAGNFSQRWQNRPYRVLSRCRTGRRCNQQLIRRSKSLIERYLALLFQSNVRQVKPHPRVNQTTEASGDRYDLACSYNRPGHPLIPPGGRLWRRQIRNQSFAAATRTAGIYQPEPTYQSRLPLLTLKNKNRANPILPREGLQPE